MKILILLGVLLIPSQVMALEENYICDVKQVVQLSDSGNLGKPIPAYETLAGQSFLVNRTTGKLDGTVSWLRTSELEKVTIISDGREENDFKSISVSQPPTSLVTYLHIHEVGTEKIKPFSLATGMLIIGGTCK